MSHTWYPAYYNEEYVCISRILGTRPIHTVEYMCICLILGTRPIHNVVDVYMSHPRNTAYYKVVDVCICRIP